MAETEAMQMTIRAKSLFVEDAFEDFRLDKRGERAILSLCRRGRARGE